MRSFSELKTWQQCIWIILALLFFCFTIFTCAHFILLYRAYHKSTTVRVLRRDVVPMPSLLICPSPSIQPGPPVLRFHLDDISAVTTVEPTTSGNLDILNISTTGATDSTDWFEEEIDVATTQVTTASPNTTASMGRQIEFELQNLTQRGQLLALAAYQPSISDSVPFYALDQVAATWTTGESSEAGENFAGFYPRGQIREDLFHFLGYDNDGENKLFTVQCQLGAQDFNCSRLSKIVPSVYGPCLFIDIKQNENNTFVEAGFAGSFKVKVTFLTQRESKFWEYDVDSPNGDVENEDSQATDCNSKRGEKSYDYSKTNTPEMIRMFALSNWQYHLPRATAIARPGSRNLEIGVAYESYKFLGLPYADKVKSFSFEENFLKDLQNMPSYEHFDRDRRYKNGEYSSDFAKLLRHRSDMKMPDCASACNILAVIYACGCFLPYSSHIFSPEDLDDLTTAVFGPPPPQTYKGVPARNVSDFICTSHNQSLTHCVAPVLSAFTSLQLPGLSSNASQCPVKRKPDSEDRSSYRIPPASTLCRVNCEEQTHSIVERYSLNINHVIGDNDNNDNNDDDDDDDDDIIRTEFNFLLYPIELERRVYEEWPTYPLQDLLRNLGLTVVMYAVLFAIMWTFVQLFTQNCLESWKQHRAQRRVEANQELVGNKDYDFS